MFLHFLGASVRNCINLRWSFSPFWNGRIWSYKPRAANMGRAYLCELRAPQYQTDRVHVHVQGGGRGQSSALLVLKHLHGHLLAVIYWYDGEVQLDKHQILCRHIKLEVCLILFCVESANLNRALGTFLLNFLKFILMYFCYISTQHPEADILLPVQ